MIDSMTRDDVLSALGEISKHFEGCTKETYGSIHELFHRWTNAADWAAAYLNDPAPTVGGWISVKDRLPEEKMNPYTQDYQEVICLLSTRFGSDVRVYKFGRGHFWNGPCEIDKYITHWMPLPEPPEEES